MRWPLFRAEAHPVGWAVLPTIRTVAQCAVDKLATLRTNAPLSGVMADTTCPSSNEIFDVLEDWNKVLEADRAAIEKALNATEKPTRTRRVATQMRGPSL